MVKVVVAELRTDQKRRSRTCEITFPIHAKRPKMNSQETLLLFSTDLTRIFAEQYPKFHTDNVILRYPQIYRPKAVSRIMELVFVVILNGGLRT